jgi:hypothetical protein
MAEQTGIITTTQDQIVDSWLTNVSAAQDIWFSAINDDNPLRIAFAEATAKKLMLQTLKGENAKHIAAHLLAFADPEIDMIEVVGVPAQAEMIRVIAMGVITGFVPGQDEFSVFGTRNGADLYVKENGYYSLFSRLKGCSVPDVRDGFPELTKLDNGKLVWRVSGTASVEINGKTINQICEGPYAIGLQAAESRNQPGVSTDNVAGISAKARRRLLQLLWKKVRCSARIDDLDDTVPLVAAQPEQEPARIEAPATVINMPETVVITHNTCDPWAAEWKRFPEDHPARKLARKMRESAPESLDSHMIEADQLIGDKLIDKRAHESLSRYFNHLKGVTA